MFHSLQVLEYFSRLCCAVNNKSSLLLISSTLRSQPLTLGGCCFFSIQGDARFGGIHEVTYYGFFILFAGMVETCSKKKLKIRDLKISKLPDKLPDLGPEVVKFRARPKDMKEPSPILLASPAAVSDVRVEFVENMRGTVPLCQKFIIGWVFAQMDDISTNLIMFCRSDVKVRFRFDSQFLKQGKCGCLEGVISRL